MEVRDEIQKQQLSVDGGEHLDDQRKCKAHSPLYSDLSKTQRT